MPLAPSAATCARKREMPRSMEGRSGKIQLVPAGESMIAILKMPRRHLVNAHCFGAYGRPRLTDDDGTRGATANQADNGERRCTNPEKFHTKLTSRGTAKSRFNVVAAAVSRGKNARSPPLIAVRRLPDRSCPP